MIYHALNSDCEIRLPLQPFHGTIGVAPAAYEARNVLVPEAFGGNMDTPEACAGADALPRCQRPGALFSLGDGHYTMGEGEVCGAAVEGAMTTTLTVDVIKESSANGRDWKATTRSWSRARTDHSRMRSGSRIRSS